MLQHWNRKPKTMVFTLKDPDEPSSPLAGEGLILRQAQDRP